MRLSSRNPVLAALTEIRCHPAGRRCLPEMYGLRRNGNACYGLMSVQMWGRDLEEVWYIYGEKGVDGIGSSTRSLKELTWEESERQSEAMTDDA